MNTRSAKDLAGSGPLIPRVKIQNSLVENPSNKQAAGGWNKEHLLRHDFMPDSLPCRMKEVPKDSCLLICDTKSLGADICALGSVVKLMPTAILVGGCEGGMSGRCLGVQQLRMRMLFQHASSQCIIDSTLGKHIPLKHYHRYAGNGDIYPIRDPPFHHTDCKIWRW